MSMRGKKRLRLNPLEKFDKALGGFGRFCDYPISSNHFRATWRETLTGHHRSNDRKTDSFCQGRQHGRFGFLEADQGFVNFT